MLVDVTTIDNESVTLNTKYICRMETGCLGDEIAMTDFKVYSVKPGTRDTIKELVANEKITGGLPVVVRR